MEFNPELKENIKNPEQEVRQAFADFEIDLEGIDSSVLVRLIEIHSEENSHFYDAIEMAKMLDKNWEHLGLENIDKKKMLVCALLHDVGKSGPEQASIEARQLCLWLFHKQHHVQTEIDVRELKVMDFINTSDYPDPKRARELLTAKDGLNIANLDNLTMIDFWRMHVDWTYDILSQHLSKEVDEKIVVVTASHHLLDGKNPAHLEDDKLPTESRWLEMTEQYQVLTLVDKYQALRHRSAMSHEEAVAFLLQMIDASKIENTLKTSYKAIVAKFFDADFNKNFEDVKSEVQNRYNE